MSAYMYVYIIYNTSLQDLHLSKNPLGDKGVCI
jgi:hypothetical protein